MENLEIDAATLAALTELSSIENAPVKTVLERAVNDYRRTVAAGSLAPDGLPWPPGYFDCTPKQSFETALKEFGVRPSHYHQGWPVYTKAETTLPQFISHLPEESPEQEKIWRDAWNEGRNPQEFISGLKRE